MQYADPHTNWPEWAQENDDRDEPTKLLALREYIFDLARTWVGRENITAEWINKKLAKLAIADRIDVEHSYEVDVPVTATLPMRVFAANRTEALAKVASAISPGRGASVKDITATGAPAFTSGPEDEDPEVIDPDAPTTVDGTLAMFREIIMLGHIAGPKFCDVGANDVLAAFGLDPIPPRRTYKIARPVEAVMATTVEAYDLASAETVARWRWENDRTTYQLVGGDPTGDPSVI